jgi:PKHD-type hydroxylase
MILKNPYYYFDKVFKKEECENLIKIGSNLILEEAKTKGKDKNYRKGKISWLSENWIYDRLNCYLEETNKEAGWNFEYSFIEPLQFTKYDKENYYDWHTDGNSDHYSVYKNHLNKNFNGKIRKISATISLSSQNDYGGGDLEFDWGLLGRKTIKEIKNQGSVVFFPSFTQHKITPITRGTRYSLVMWVLGTPFK